MQTQPNAAKSSPAALPWREDYWELVSKRDRKADGIFYYSVETTGVYCRPSCSARLAKPQNVRFYKSCADAERAGFRACKRCRPDGASPAEEQASRVVRICQAIDESDSVPTLEQLAREVGITPFHLQRVFKAATGLTPKGYAAARRSQRVRSQLNRGEGTITEAMYAAGYNSNGRFYGESQAILGMTPSSFRSGGDMEDIKFALGECSLGVVLVAQSQKGVCAISLGNDPEILIADLQRQFPKARLLVGDQDFEAVVAKVVGFVDSPSIGCDLPLDLRGTAFQQRVWKALTEIPVGTRVSYTELARRIGAPASVRAVAQACGSNQLAVAIPCHRVVRQNGELAGYRWGIERKRQILQRETES